MLLPPVKGVGVWIRQSTLTEIPECLKPTSTVPVTNCEWIPEYSLKKAKSSGSGASIGAVITSQTPDSCNKKCTEDLT